MHGFDSQVAPFYRRYTQINSMYSKIPNNLKTEPLPVPRISNRGFSNLINFDFQIKIDFSKLQIYFSKLQIDF